MNTLLKAISVVALGAVGAAGVMFMCHNCPKRKAELDNQITTAISKYIDKNPELILEKIAKTDIFANTVKNYALTNEDALRLEIKNYLESNQHIIREAINSNQDIVTAIVNSDAFKQALPTVSAPAPQNSEPEEKAESSNQKYHDNWDKLTQNPLAPYVGPKDAKVTVVEFFDFACSHCKTMGPLVSELIKNNPDVKFVFQPLFFISEHSPYAAKASVAAFQKGKFAEVYQGILTLPQISEEAINQILVDEGLNVDEIKSMAEDKEIRRGIQEIDALSQVLGVGGVPLMIINGQEVHSRDYNELQQILNSFK